MADEKSDLTQIKDLDRTASPKQEEAAETPSPSIELPNEDAFETLEEFSKSSPQTDFPTSDSEPPAIEAPPELDLLPPTENENRTETETETAQTQTGPAPVPVFNPAPSPSSNPMADLRNYSETLSVGQPTVESSFPFSLRITGHLTENEKAKLLDLLSREKMGIRETDLEPQFRSGRILLPRISEYAGVLLVQALRGTAAKIQLIPTDAEDELNLNHPSHPNQDEIYIAESEGQQHPAENLPVTADNSLPAMPHYLVIDVVTGTAILKSHVVESKGSSEYQEIIEALQRELKYKAYRKGATAILNFSVNLTKLSTPTDYRLTVAGSAVKKA